MYPPGETFYETVCYPGAVIHMVYLPPGTTPPPAGVPAAQLAARAVTKLPLPAMASGSAPGAQGRAFAMTFVNMPTFLWVDNTAWHTYSATADDGLKAVTATATPSVRRGAGGSATEGPGAGAPRSEAGARCGGIATGCGAPGVQLSSPPPWPALFYAC